MDNTDFTVCAERLLFILERSFGNEDEYQHLYDIRAIFDSLESQEPVPLEALVSIFQRAVLDPDVEFPSEIATKVGMGVFVINEQLFTRIVSDHSDLLQFIIDEYDIDLFGLEPLCTCAQCSRSFLEELTSSSLLQKMFIVREITFCQSVASLIIREMMF